MSGKICNQMDVALSIIIPVYNEEENINPLYDKLTKDVQPLNLSYELLFIDDGSKDKTKERIIEITRKDPRVSFIVFRRNFGKSAALNTGFRYAKGSVIITMDGDLQDDSAEIYKFLEKINDGYDLVSGWKFPRNDPISKTLPSRVFNKLTCFVTGVHLHDFNCGFKAYRKEVTKTINLFGEMHRYTPVLAESYGFKIGEVTVKHHPRKFGVSKFGISRLMNGFLDLISIKFLTRYYSRPLHVFGIIGIISLFIGFILGLYLTLLQILYHQAIGERPLLLMSVLFLIVGLQFIGIGLIGEMINYHYQETDNTIYLIREIHGENGGDQ